MQPVVVFKRNPRANDVSQQVIPQAIRGQPRTIKITEELFPLKELKVGAEKEEDQNNWHAHQRNLDRHNIWVYGFTEFAGGCDAIWAEIDFGHPAD